MGGDHGAISSRPRGLVTRVNSDPDADTNPHPDSATDNLAPAPLLDEVEEYYDEYGPDPWLASHVCRDADGDEYQLRLTPDITEDLELD